MTLITTSAKSIPVDNFQFRYVSFTELLAS
jgi:hypothetical protein